ncbi:hypothetical protein [Nocardioides sp. B-3]|uniref:hypothetical protein n=1 Tax=Nocardioides sp. B-3 TaxID=2895565 RepID=UPI0021539A75|nr:hypothetical protein [Nocardioides sp. B-3]UUZ57657.1 hypothetical protein LP418_14475 [Nocardioides sp. B-3]
MANNGHLRLLSAAAHWGWKVKWSAQWPQIRVATKPTEFVDASLTVGALPRADLDGWATSRVRTVPDCAAELSFDEALSVADSALRSGEVSREDLEAVRPADAAVRRVIEHASPLAANPFESVLRAILIQAGISVVPQWATTIDGITYHPDLADPFNGIAIEANSFAHHAEKQDHDDDCLRYNAPVTGGWIVLRFTRDQVMFKPGDVIATVRAAPVLRGCVRLREGRLREQSAVRHGVSLSPYACRGPCTVKAAPSRQPEEVPARRVFPSVGDRDVVTIGASVGVGTTHGLKALAPSVLVDGELEEFRRPSDPRRGRSA